VRDLISEACAFGSRIDKGLIDDQQPASPPQAIREREQCVLGDDPAIGIVGTMAMRASASCATSATSTTL
jgi:hypothetical protein